MHPTQTPEYWDALARDERAFADADRAQRRDVESIALHIKNAEAYEAKATALRAALTTTRPGNGAARRK